MYVVIDNQHRVLDSHPHSESDLHQSAADHGARIVNVGTADVGTLARIAAADCPRLTKVGDGFLGAGTDPAQPYLSAMLGMDGVGTVYPVSDIRFGYDSADVIVRYFLGNAQTWRGPVARAVKARLNDIIERG